MKRRKFLCNCGRWVSVTSAQPTDGRFTLRQHRTPSAHGGDWCATKSAPFPESVRQIVEAREDEAVDR